MRLTNKIFLIIMFSLMAGLIGLCARVEGAPETHNLLRARGLDYALKAVFKISKQYCGLISRPYTYSAGNIIYSDEVNSNETTIYGEFNGNIESVNILDGTIVNNDIHNATIAQAKMLCSGYWSTLTACDAAADNADALHTHDITTLQNYASVSSAIATLTNIVGTSSASDTTVMRFLAASYSAEFAYPGSVAAYVATTTITASQTTSLKGVVVNVEACIDTTGPSGGGWGVGMIDLQINTTYKNSFISQYADETTISVCNSKSVDWNFATYGFAAGTQLLITTAWRDASYGAGGPAAAWMNINQKVYGY